MSSTRFVAVSNGSAKFTFPSLPPARTIRNPFARRPPSLAGQRKALRRHSSSLQSFYAYQQEGHLAGYSRNTDKKRSHNVRLHSGDIEVARPRPKPHLAQLVRNSGDTWWRSSGCTCTAVKVGMSAPIGAALRPVSRVRIDLCPGWFGSQSSAPSTAANMFVRCAGIYRRRSKRSPD